MEINWNFFSVCNRDRNISGLWWEGRWKQLRHLSLVFYATSLHRNRKCSVPAPPPRTGLSIMWHKPGVPSLLYAGVKPSPWQSLLTHLFFWRAKPVIQKLCFIFKPSARNTSADRDSFSASKTFPLIPGGMRSSKSVRVLTCVGHKRFPVIAIQNGAAGRRPKQTAHLDANMYVLLSVHFLFLPCFLFPFCFHLNWNLLHF